MCVCQEAPGCPVIAHLGAVGDKESEMRFSVRHTAVIMNLISVPKLTRPGEHDTFNCGRYGRSTKPKLYCTVQCPNEKVTNKNDFKIHLECDPFEAESLTCKAGAYVTMANKGQSINHQTKERV